MAKSLGMFSPLEMNGIPEASKLFSDKLMLISWSATHLNPQLSIQYCHEPSTDGDDDNANVGVKEASTRHGTKGREVSAKPLTLCIAAVDRSSRRSRSSILNAGHLPETN